MYAKFSIPLKGFDFQVVLFMFWKSSTFHTPHIGHTKTVTKSLLSLLVLNRPWQSHLSLLYLLLKSENWLKHDWIRAYLYAGGVSSSGNDNAAASARQNMQTKSVVERQRLLGWYNAIPVWLCCFQIQVRGSTSHCSVFQAHVGSFGIAVPCPATRVMVILLPGRNCDCGLLDVILSTRTTVP